MDPNCDVRVSLSTSTLLSSCVFFSNQSGTVYCFCSDTLPLLQCNDTLPHPMPKKTQTPKSTTFGKKETKGKEADQEVSSDEQPAETTAEQKPKKKRHVERYFTCTKQLGRANEHLWCSGHGPSKKSCERKHWCEKQWRSFIGSHSPHTLQHPPLTFNVVVRYQKLEFFLGTKYPSLRRRASWAGGFPNDADIHVLKPDKKFLARWNKRDINEGLTPLLAMFSFVCRYCARTSGLILL
jgi:hypothetical protein